MKRDGGKYSKKIYYGNLYDASNATLPFKYFLYNDNNLIIYDDNFKLIGSIKNKKNLKNVDFVLPDGVELWNNNHTCYIYVDDNQICYRTTIDKKNRTKINKPFCYKANFLKAYDDINIYMSGYLIVTKDGSLKHVNYENDLGVDWEIFPVIKGEGPYRMEVEEGCFVLKNGAGEIYWTSDFLGKDKKYYKDW